MSESVQQALGADECHYADQPRWSAFSPRNLKHEQIPGLRVPAGRQAADPTAASRVARAFVTSRHHRAEFYQ